MDRVLAEEIIECLPRGKTLFRYHRQRYALMLLQSLIGASCPIAAIRNSRFRRLLELPVVKTALHHSGDGRLSADQLEYSRVDRCLPFLLTLDIWPGYAQVSRRGVNLVLQLNFTNHHDSPYRRLVRPSAFPRFRCESHPIMKPGERELFRETFAWSRIDLDFDSNEALIEEVQSDWARVAHRLGLRVARCLELKRPLPQYYGLDGRLDLLKVYLDRVLPPYLAIWDEAMLSASIDFIRRELGIDTIYYHQQDTGRKLKDIRLRPPPRSLYTRLPRKFCFDETDAAPGFLLQSEDFAKRYRQIHKPRWFRLQTDGLH